MTPLHTQMLEEAEAELDAALERTRRAMRRMMAYSATATSNYTWEKSEEMVERLRGAEHGLDIALNHATVMLAKERSVASAGPVTP